MQSIRREAPRIGGSFAVWGGLFSSFDCILVALRQKGIVSVVGIDAALVGIDAALVGIDGGGDYK